MSYNPPKDCIRVGDRRYQYAKRRLRQAGIQFTPGESRGWGAWVHGMVNPRTGSEWHSPDEVRALVNQKLLA